MAAEPIEPTEMETNVNNKEIEKKTGLHEGDVLELEGVRVVREPDPGPRAVSHEREPETK